MAVRVRAVPVGQTGVSPAGGVTLLPTGGDVAFDAGADVRATVDLSIAAHDPDTGLALWPAASDSVLTPYGAYELFIERGVAFGGGSIEYVGLGYYRIDNVDQGDAPDGPIQLSGKDRMSMVVDTRLTTPLVFAATDTLGDIVDELVGYAVPGVVIEWDDATDSEPIGRAGFTPDDNRYGFLREILTGVGKVGSFDHRGILVIRTPPDPRSRPSWTVSRGRDGVLVSASRSLSREGVANGVFATGESVDTEPPVSALVVDSDPDSPTFWGGPFGRIAKPFASPLLTTAAQCELAAATVLRRSTGLPYNADFSAVPNPAVEVEDVIALGIEGSPVQYERKLIVGDSFTRTVVDGTGTSETGHAYGTNSTQTQVNGGTFKRGLASANTTGSSTNGSDVGQRNVRMYVDVRVPNAATGGTLVSGLTLRNDGLGTEFYTLRHEFTASGTVHAVVSRHSAVLGFTDLAKIADWTTYTAGEWWTICAESDGPYLRFKAWRRDTEAEPDEWLLISDRGNEIAPVVNRFGMWFWRLNGNTNTGLQWELDNYRVYSLPVADLKGGEVHVLDTITIPLTADQAMQGTTRQQTLVTAGVL